MFTKLVVCLLVFYFSAPQWEDAWAAQTKRNVIRTERPWTLVGLTHFLEDGHEADLTHTQTHTLTTW